MSERTGEMMVDSRKAFTMVELIFVIVIIGILASVALPKLAATRDDAKIGAIISHARNAIGDFSSFYTSQGNLNWKNAKVNLATNVPLETTCGNPVDTNTELSPTEFVLCDDNVVCLTLETFDEGNLSITDGTVTTSIICEAVKSDPAIIALSNKTFRLGGNVINR